MEPIQSNPGEVEWWLCSHLISVAVAETSSETGVALLEEVSAGGVRFVAEEPIPEGSRARLKAGEFEVGVVVSECRVRADDIQVEACFDAGFRWTPDVWSPDHLYRPPRPHRKARGAGQS